MHACTFTLSWAHKGLLKRNYWSAESRNMADVSNEQCCEIVGLVVCSSQLDGFNFCGYV